MEVFYGLYIYLFLFSLYTLATATAKAASDNARHAHTDQLKVERIEIFSIPAPRMSPCG